jgi:uncharacterized OB-fold protein
VPQNVYGNGDDDINAEFWKLLATGRFHTQQCVTCGRHRFPPNNVCPLCHSLAYRWLPVAGPAVVYSYTLIRRAPNEEWAARAPYLLVVAQLAEGPLVLGHLRAAAEFPVEVGTQVDLVVVQASGTRPVYEFKPIQHRIKPSGQRPVVA